MSNEGKMMKTMSAKVLDPKHLELTEPLPSTVGEWVQIAIPETDTERADWQKAVSEHFLSAYDDQDAIYDEL